MWLRQELRARVWFFLDHNFIKKKTASTLSLVTSLGVCHMKSVS